MNIRHGVAGLLAYVVALIALAPAALLAPLADAYSGGRIGLSGLSGGFWNGAAERLEIRAAGHPSLRLDQVRWRIRPQRLLTGDAPVFIENRGGDLTLSGWVCPAGDGIRLSRAQLAAPLASLVPHLPGLAGQGLAGELRLAADDLTLGKRYVGKGSGELRLDAGGNLKLPIGRYVLALEGKGERMAIRWNGPQGPRVMSGGGEWDGRLHLDGVPGLARDAAH